MYFDLQFHYNNLVRDLSIYRWYQVSTCYTLPAITATRLYFQVNRVEQVDAPRAYNYYYLFRFFLGIQAKVRGYKATFTYGNSYWDYTIEVISWSGGLSFLLFFIIYETLPFVNVTTALTWYWRGTHIPTLVFWEVNYYTEKKANLGLFELVDPLQCEYITNSGLFTHFILNSYKLHLPNFHEG